MSDKNEYGVWKRVGEFGAVDSTFAFVPGSKPLPPDSRAALFYELTAEHGSFGFLLSGASDVSRD